MHLSTKKLLIKALNLFTNLFETNIFEKPDSDIILNALGNRKPKHAEDEDELLSKKSKKKGLGM